MSKNINAVGRGQHVHFGKLLSEESIQQRRFSGLHFADHHDEQRLANVSEEPLKSIEPRRSTTHFRTEPEQTSERSVELAPKLQILIRDHPAATNRSPKIPDWQSWLLTAEGELSPEHSRVRGAQP